MIVLTVRTDKPLSEIGLFQNGKLLEYKEWEAHRALAETIHKKVDEILNVNELLLKNVEGIVVYKGPGSFTGLRIGVSVANALAYSLTIPIVGSSNEDWITEGIKMLRNSQNDMKILPEYGAPVFTTKPRK